MVTVYSFTVYFDKLCKMTRGFLEKLFNIDYFAANLQLSNYQLFKVILNPVKKLKVFSIKINIRLFL